MIIFDLDDTLADCEHRRHLVDPDKYPEICEYSNYRMIDGQPFIDLAGKPSWRYKKTGDPFQHGLKAFYEACDQDMPIDPVIKLLEKISQSKHIEIWSDRCESVRKKTEDWLRKNTQPFYKFDEIRMSPAGCSIPVQELFAKWYREYYDSLYPKLDKDAIEGTTYHRKGKIEMVFSANPAVIAMFRKRGIFVFDCNQSGKEF